MTTSDIFQFALFLFSQNTIGPAIIMLLIVMMFTWPKGMPSQPQPRLKQDEMGRFIIPDTECKFAVIPFDMRVGHEQAFSQLEHILDILHLNLGRPADFNYLLRSRLLPRGWSPILTLVTDSCRYESRKSAPDEMATLLFQDGREDRIFVGPLQEAVPDQRALFRDYNAIFYVLAVSDFLQPVLAPRS